MTELLQREIEAHLEKMSSGDRLLFTAKNVTRQDTALFITVEGKKFVGTFGVQGEREKPEVLFEEHMSNFKSFGKLDIKGLQAVLEKR